MVKGTSSLEVGNSDVVEESSSAGGGRSRNDIVLLQPSSELVVVPRREDVVLGIVKLLGGLCGSVGSLGREGLVARRGLTVGR